MNNFAIRQPEKAAFFNPVAYVRRFLLEKPMLIKNIKPAVVVLNGMTVLAPMQEAEVADDDAGVLSLVESGYLEVLDKPKREKKQ